MSCAKELKLVSLVTLPFFDSLKITSNKKVEHLIVVGNIL